MTINNKIEKILTESTINALSEKMNHIITMAENSTTGNEEIFTETLSILMENAYNTINQTRTMNGKKALSEERFYQIMESILEERGNRFKDSDDGTSSLASKQSQEGVKINKHIVEATAVKAPTTVGGKIMSGAKSAGTAVGNKWNNMGKFKKGAVIAGAAGLGLYAMNRMKVRKCKQNCMSMGDDVQKNLCLKRCGA